METLINVIAYTSLIVGGLATLLNIIVIINILFSNNKLVIHPMFFFWLTLTVWPIVYLIVK